MDHKNNKTKFNNPLIHKKITLKMIYEKVKSLNYEQRKKLYYMLLGAELKNKNKD